MLDKFMFVCEFVKLLSKYGENDSRQREKIRRILEMNKMRRECRSQRWSQGDEEKEDKQQRRSWSGCVLYCLCTFTARCMSAVGRRHKTKFTAPNIWAWYLCSAYGPSVRTFDAMRNSVEILKRKLSMTYVCHAKAMPKITTDCCNFIISNMRCAPWCVCVCGAKCT